MTNREYMMKLSSDELAKFIYKQIFHGVGANCTDSVRGVADWLDMEYKPEPKDGFYVMVDGKMVYAGSYDEAMARLKGKQG